MFDNKKKINFNLHIYVFIIIATITIINDNIIYFTNLKYEISLIFSCILVIIFNIYLLRKKVFKIENDFNKLDLIAVIPYSIIYFIIILHIDDFIDTISYHLYNQKNPFIDRINFDLLPSSSFFFPLGDRMNYIFVRLLGYRFGNILSLYSSIIIFYQIKRFLTIITPEINSKLKIFIATLFLYTFSVNLCIGEYSIDIFSMVILLELLYIAVKRINIFEFKQYLYLSIFLAGIATGIKISNIIFAVPIVLYMSIKSIKNYKNIKFYDLFIGIILFFIPFGVYMINACVQTQNPIFPFCNYIFKSNYYEEVSSKDLRLGAKNLEEIILWPIIIILEPLRGDDIRKLVDPIWGTGYIISIYCLMKNKENKKVLNLAFLNILLTILWIIFASGYVRYGMFIAIAYFLIEIYLLDKVIVELIKKKSINNILDLFLKILLIAIIVIQMIFSLFIGIVYIIEKIKDTINDFSYTIEENAISGIYDINGVWISSRYNTSCIDLIRNENDPMYNVDIITEKDPMMNVKSNYSDLSKKIFYEKIKRKRIIYSCK